jgi:hypothetical protein
MNWSKLRYLIVLALIGITLVFSNAFALSPDILKPPLIQFKLGIPLQDIKCKENLLLLINPVNGHPSCVKTNAVSRLLTNGWVSIGKFETAHPNLLQNQTGTSTTKNINSSILTNYTAKNIIYGNFRTLTSNNTRGSVQNQTMLNYADCTSLVPTFLDNPPPEIYPHSVKPFPPVMVNPAITSTEAGKIKILEIGMCPTQLKVGDKPHFTLTYKNISDKSFYHHDIHAYSHLLVYNISPPDKAKENISLGGPAVGLAQFVGLLIPNQIAIDPAIGAGLLNEDIRTILFGPSGEYQITNSGMLTVTMYLGLQEVTHDLVETIRFNVNATQ